MGVVDSITISALPFDVYAVTLTTALADADAYFVGRFGTTVWDAATDDEKSKALVSAARWLDRLTWGGTLTDPTTPQPMSWPRTNANECDGVTPGTAEVPQRILEAQWELAQIILADATEQESAGQGTNVKRVKAGSAEVEFFENDVGSRRDTKLPPIAHDLVKCYLGGGNGLGIPYVKGAGTVNGTPSVFDDADQSDFNTPGLS